jgi:hypothetical protein
MRNYAHGIGRCLGQDAVEEAKQAIETGDGGLDEIGAQVGRRGCHLLSPPIQAAGGPHPRSLSAQVREGRGDAMSIFSGDVVAAPQ